MTTKGKTWTTLTEWEVLMAISASKEYNYIDITDCAYSWGQTPDEYFASPLESKNPNPEQILLWKELVESLSTEAKDIINIVLNSPAEVLEFFLSPITKKVSKEKVKQFFRKKFGGRKAEKTFKELKTFLNEKSEIGL